MSETVEGPKLNEFEPPAYADWLELVARELKGASFEKRLIKQIAGVEIAPLYTRNEGLVDSGLPGFSPYTRGSFATGHVDSGWDVRPLVRQADVSTAAQAIAEELSGGATSVMLVFDDPARGGSGSLGDNGIACANLADLERLFAAVALDKTPLALDAGDSTLPIAAGLFALARRRGIDVRTLSGALGADPLAVLARFGALSTSLEGALHELTLLAQFTHARAPFLRSVGVDTAPYHEAGADAATEIGIALASGLTYLRAMTDAGMTLDDAANQLVFRFSVGRDFFLEVAKLRAARTCWAQVIAASGGAGRARAMVIHASTSRRTKTARDPWVNLLRATCESFSAALGGAEAITTGNFDEALGESDGFARHLSRNTQHLLRHEAHLHRVIDAPGGSFYIESLTQALAKQAWSTFQDFERRGPFPRLLLEGILQAELKQSLEQELRAVATRKIAITGVNEYPHVREIALSRAGADTAALEAHSELARERGKAALGALSTTPSVEAAIEALDLGATFASVRAVWSDRRAVRAPRLLSVRLSQPFEDLRDMSDRFLAQKGSRPRVFLANLGSIAVHKARAQFAQSFMEAGGFETLTNDGFESAALAASAFLTSGAEVCVLCSSDDVYAELAVDVARALSAHAPKALLLAGNPGEREGSYRAAGVTDFIFAGMDVVESLRSLLLRVGAV